MIIDSTGWNDMKDNRENDKNATLPYDESDLESIIRYASRLTGRSLEELIEGGELRIEESRSKGRFGQIVERDYFGIPTNSIAEPDFRKVGMELKVTPMKKVGKGLVSKERLVLGIIDYDKVPELGFDMFLKKSSHILIVFYLWEKDEDMLRYRFLKVVDWTPSEDEIRMIESDWNVIEDYVETGRAHLLSEKHTKLLAACTKGAGHGKDMRHQPFSGIFRVISKERFMKDPVIILSYMMDFGFDHREVRVLRTAISEDRKRFENAMTCPDGSVDAIVSRIADYCYVSEKVLGSLVRGIRRAMNRSGTDIAGLSDCWNPTRPCEILHRDGGADYEGLYLERGWCLR